MTEKPIKQLMENRRRAAGPERRQELVLAAFRCLATDGFEGLRMRGVAAAVGVNIATLHYHFPTKEDLVRGVVEYSQRRFATTMPAAGRPYERLRDHLRALRRLMVDEPELCQVLAEIALRAYRDPVIAEILRVTEETWFGTLRTLLAGGVDDGGLAAGLDPDGTAALIMTTVKGTCLPTARLGDPDRLARAFDQLERWIAVG